MITPVKLYGFLGRKYGKVHSFDISTPGEAVKALFANFPEFQKDVRDFKGEGFRVYVGNRPDSIAVEETSFPFAGEEIRIVPIVQGSKDAGVGQIIVGTVLIAIGLALTYFLASNPVSPYLYKAGAIMILGGVTQMLFAPPVPTGPSEQAKNNPSYVFNGPVNTTAQGHCVPVGYGELEVGGAVINGGINAEVYAPNSGGGFGGGSGGSGGSGGRCPVPETLINISPDTFLEAGLLKPGDRVWTQHEDTLQWGYFDVESVERVNNSCLTLLLADGRSLTASWNHRVLVYMESIDTYVWTGLHELGPGDLIMGAQTGEVRAVEPAGDREVMKISVRGARTYQTSGITSHNVKVLST